MTRRQPIPGNQRSLKKATYSIVLRPMIVEYVDDIALQHNRSRSGMIDHILDLLRQGIIKLP